MENSADLNELNVRVKRIEDYLFNGGSSSIIEKLQQIQEELEGLKSHTIDLDKKLNKTISIVAELRCLIRSKKIKIAVRGH